MSRCLHRQAGLQPAAAFWPADHAFGDIDDVGVAELAQFGLHVGTAIAGPADSAIGRVLSPLATASMAATNSQRPDAS